MQRSLAENISEDFRHEAAQVEATVGENRGIVT
jgi:hypothetical protein